MSDTLSLYENYVLPTYGRFPLRLVRGEGCRVWDEDGREYLDFGTGVAVCSLGHAHPAVVEAIQRQAATLTHISNLYYTPGQGALAKRLVEAVGTPGRVFFCNSGAEANEGLIKLSRKYGNATIPNHSRYEIITFTGSFHGRTMAGISATGQDKVKHGFEPLLPGFRHVSFGDLEAVKAAISPATAAILLEPVQGESGIHPASAEFLRGLRALCDAHGVLLLFDEIQCGLGRTGDWCGWKSIVGDEVQPDGVSWAKGIAGGLPLGAFYVREKTFQNLQGKTQTLPTLFAPGSHGSTFGGNPLVCAVSNAVLDVIEREGLLKNAEELGGYALAALEKMDSRWIKAVRGVGLMIGIEFDPALVEALPEAKRKASASLTVVELLHEAGMLSIPAGANVVRWLPPLNIRREDIDRAVAILQSTLKNI